MRTEHPLTAYRRATQQTMQRTADRLGVSKSTISRLESGRQAPSLALLRRLDCLGISADSIVRWAPRSADADEARAMVGRKAA